MRAAGSTVQGAAEDSTLRQKLFRGRRREEGSTLVEVAIVLPTFFLLLFGFFNIMFVLFGFCDANYAANVAARYASLHSSTSANPATVASVKAVIQANLYIPGGATPTLIVNYSGNGNTVGQPVGIGILYQAVPGMALKNESVTVQAFRYITH
jgi:Flp pilus assembly protein TadG